LPRGKVLQLTKTKTKTEWKSIQICSKYVVG
jgi:hypothetical protein